MHAQTDRGLSLPPSAALTGLLAWVSGCQSCSHAAWQAASAEELAAVPVWLVLFPLASGLDSYSSSEVAVGPE